MGEVLELEPGPATHQEITADNAVDQVHRRIPVLFVPAQLMDPGAIGAAGAAVVGHAVEEGKRGLGVVNIQDMEEIHAADRVRIQEVANTILVQLMVLGIIGAVGEVVVELVEEEPREDREVVMGPDMVEDIVLDQPRIQDLATLIRVPREANVNSLAYSALN